MREESERTEKSSWHKSLNNKQRESSIAMEQCAMLMCHTTLCVKVNFHICSCLPDVIVKWSISLFYQRWPPSTHVGPVGWRPIICTVCKRGKWVQEPQAKVVFVLTFLSREGAWGSIEPSRLSDSSFKMIMTTFLVVLRLILVFQGKERGEV